MEAVGFVPSEELQDEVAPEDEAPPEERAAPPRARPPRTKSSRRGPDAMPPNAYQTAQAQARPRNAYEQSFMPAGGAGGYKGEEEAEEG